MRLPLLPWSRIEIKHDVIVEVPGCVALALREFADVMLPKFPKNLLPLRSTDNKIELLYGSMPPAQPPYCIAPKELAELRKLNNLQDTGIIHPSKAPKKKHRMGHFRSTGSTIINQGTCRNNRAQEVL